MSSPLDEERRKMKDFMDAPFLPVGSVAKDERIAKALEYIAYHLGEIDRKLDKLTGAQRP
jgi:hypothetical protein